MQNVLNKTIFFFNKTLSYLSHDF